MQRLAGAARRGAGAGGVGHLLRRLLGPPVGDRPWRPHQCTRVRRPAAPGRDVPRDRPGPARRPADGPAAAVDHARLEEPGTRGVTTGMTTTVPTGESFVHLHVASGYSMRYGTAKPHQLVERAAAYGQPALALTDRDGLYGAVKFVRACMEHDVAPILGVDLALGPEQPERQRARPVRTPVRGGTLVDPRLPRVTVLARGSNGGLAPGEGWAALCRLVTATHLRGERGNPVTTASLVAEHVRLLPTPPVPSAAEDDRPGGPEGRGGPDRRGGRHTPSVVDGGPSPLVVLLGPDSDVGRAVLAKRRDHARAALERWVALLPRGAVVVEVVCH